MLTEYMKNNIAIEEQVQVQKTSDIIDNKNIQYHIIHISSQAMEINNKIFSKVLRLHLGKSFYYNIDDLYAYVYRYSLLLLHIIRYLFSQSILSISKDLNQVNSISYPIGQHPQPQIVQLLLNMILMVYGYGHSGLEQSGKCE